jgi:hypothetical protein
VNRRSFLRLCGASGLLCAANWKPLLRGPRSGDRVVIGGQEQQLLLKVDGNVRRGMVLAVGPYHPRPGDKVVVSGLVGVVLEDGVADDTVLVCVGGEADVLLS